MENQPTPGHKIVSIETALYITGWCLLGISAIAVFYLKASHIVLTEIFAPCILYTLTGVYCPGCGGTRSVLHLLTGHPLKCLIYHPLVFYAAVVGGWFMISQTVERISRHRLAIGMKFRDGFLWAALILVVINFILKNFFLFVLHIDLLAI